MKRTTGLNKTWLLGGAAAVVILGGAGLYFLNDKPGVAAGPRRRNARDPALPSEAGPGRSPARPARLSQAGPTTPYVRSGPTVASEFWPGPSSARVRPRRPAWRAGGPGRAATMVAPEDR